ncbi:MAG: insulinase family protein, partial [Myxococcota bacterium]
TAGVWKRSSTFFPRLRNRSDQEKRFEPEFTPSAGALHLVHRSESGPTELMLGHATIPRNHTDALALLLGTMVFGGHRDSRLAVALRQSQGIGLSAGASVELKSARSPFVIRATVRQDATTVAVRTITETLNRLRRDGITDEELRDAKTRLRVALPDAFQTRRAVAASIANLFRFELPWEHYAMLPEALERIEREDVRRALEQHLDPEALNVVAIGDRTVVKEALERLNLGAVNVVE